MRTLAIALVTTALAVSPSHVRLAAQASQAPAVSPALAEALTKISAGDFAGAVPILEKITSEDAGNVRAWRAFGYALLKTRQLDRAIAVYRHAIDLTPTFAPALYNLGAALALKGEREAALEALGRAKATRAIDMTLIEIDPDLVSLKDDGRFRALMPAPADFANPFVEAAAILREWDGEATGDQFGWIARNIGDVDGDGVADIVTSAPTKDIGGANAGRVYVYSTKTSKLLWQADGKPGDQFGSGVEGAGDTNHDGIPDVIAAAPFGGYARVFSGRDGRLLLTFTAEDKNDAFGTHVSGAGDFNRDGYADVLVGAPASHGTGRAYVYSGKDGHVLLTLDGAHSGDRFGSAVAGFDDGQHRFLVIGAPGAGDAHHGRAYVYDRLGQTPKFTIDADETGTALGAMFLSVPGDLDGDGVPDIYASDWRNNAKGPATGRIYVHSGADGHRLLTVTGETAGEGFGTSASVAGDVDGDGRADLVVGAWQYAGGAGSGGRVYLYSGKDGRLIKTWTGRIPGEAFGFDAVTLGDIDRDGTIDFLLTSAWSGIHGNHSGRMFVVSSGVKKLAPHQ